MSVIDEIKQLEAKKQKLLGTAKSDALKKAQSAISDLKVLGFEYHLVEGPKVKSTGSTGSKTKKPRRTGMRKKVLKVIAASDKGLVRKEVFAAMKANDPSDKQSISNALAALKSAGEITLKDRFYKAV